ncbi:HD-GYP domain-containing protein [Thioalkalivibrio paradoxus]|uniref:Response regulator n=1 Tax=Thioalkalivibrio paradoxus ARh 1 TaxID=713585 RepID=W0DMI7_9GAMM|nr:HD domain-containing phosphohydrolase [Thioalkalivibrio paradoxus]AHE98110.1 response regulator [Thioalkalivibrio paradoxus ARh 1]
MALSERDLYTERHCARVTGIALTLGRLCGLSSRELRLLRIGSTLHDVGKIGIPDYILLKPARLDADEWAVMQRHAELGQKICDVLNIRNSEEIGRVVRHHHEAFDGTGYPDGLGGTSIPVQSRIIAIADSYDAMALARPYHSPRSHAQVMEVLFDLAGTKYDPDILDLLGTFIHRSRYRAA